METAMLVISILAGILAVVATVLAFIFIVPEKKRANMNKFGKFLHDTVNFRYLIIEKILQALYIYATASVVLLGFFMLFYVQPGYDSYYYRTPATWYGGYGLLLIILGPIVVRLAYELLMMAVLLVKNVIQINNKIKNENGEEKADIFAVPDTNFFKAPVTETTASAEGGFCQNCGTKVENGASFCPTCGTKL